MWPLRSPWGIIYYYKTAKWGENGHRSMELPVRFCSWTSCNVNTELSMPRNRGAQRNRPNAGAQTPSEYWKLNMYLPFVDHLIAELNTILLRAEPRYVAQKLITQNIVPLTLGCWRGNLWCRWKWCSCYHRRISIRNTELVSTMDSRYRWHSWKLTGIFNILNICMYAGLDGKGGTVCQYHAKSEDLLEKYHDNQSFVWAWLIEHILWEKQTQM